MVFGWFFFANLVLWILRGFFDCCDVYFSVMVFNTSVIELHVLVDGVLVVFFHISTV